ncbi:MAG: biotin transporter BioY [Clostridiales bacterium]|nr:biotin transporter BioY [Clostridiales bacterium]
MMEHMTAKKTGTTAGIQIHDMTKVALFTALMCILAPMSVPIGPVPISLANLVIFLSLYVIGRKDSSVSVLIYLLLGLVGLPVFSGYTGGPAKLLGPTGGYLIGYILIPLVGGLAVEKQPENYVYQWIAIVFSDALCYVLGTAWFVYLMKCSLAYAMSICVLPFIGLDLCKIVTAILIGTQIHRRLVRANLC